MQQSKIQQYCEGVIEAGWLAALIVTPLFFNVFSSRVFEPDKISLVRSISLVMLLAYLVKVIDGGPLWLAAGGQNATAGRNPAAQPSPAQDARAAIAWRSLWRLPLLLPVALLVAAYALSTLLSVAPHVSWWGSYYRLQGAYTFTSYLIIAILTAAHLRQPAQLRRLQHTVILTSLPIAIYGLIQRYGGDPLPWGEDVTVRIYGNAGNPIFLAAYLIMAFFLTLERVFSSFAFLLADGPQPGDKAEPTQDTSARPLGHNLAAILLSGSYLFVLIVQLLAIFWTQSRGPGLGLAGGIYIFGLLLLTGIRPRNYRFWTVAWVGLGVAGAILLVLLNTTSLGNSIRHLPTWGRFTTMLDSSGGTGRVRVLIWQGVSEMVSPHPPLTYPDGKEDSVNLLRPLVGYGPETMSLAFSRFYPPELGQLEARNSSPDRSHNETWDSLAITGVFGFLASSLLYLSIFFWALRWLGLIRSRRDAALFFGLSIGGGLLLGALFWLRGTSIGLLGVNWPTGMIIGLIVYVTVAVFLQPDSIAAAGERRRQLLIMALLSAIIAHYVEIHFGIAIAATRVYFGITGALLLAIGMRWLVPEPFATGESPADLRASAAERAGRGRSSRSLAQSTAGRSRHRAAAARRGGVDSIPKTVMPDLLVMMTLIFLYTSNPQGSSNPVSILIRSLTMPAWVREQASGSSILWLVIFTLVTAVALGTFAAILLRPRATPGRRSGKPPARAKRGDGPAPQGARLSVVLAWARAAGQYGLVLFTGWFLYGLIHAGRLLPNVSTFEIAQQLDHVAGHFSLYTWIVVFWCLISGLVLAWRAIREPRRAWMNRALATASGAVLLTAVTLLLVGNVNIAQVRADVFYKEGNKFDNAGNWVESADLYRRALTVRPSEDFYMLFLGRSLLEGAARASQEGSILLPSDLSLEDVLRLTAQEIARLGQEELLRVAEVVLLRAQEVNPLNTDHTGNLGRLYLSWSGWTSDPQVRMQSLERSLQQFTAALTLSPNAAHLWNEKGSVLVVMGEYEEAERTYQHSLSLDDRFETTYVLLAELYGRTGETEKLKEIVQRGMSVLPNSLRLLSHWGVAQSRAGDLEGSLATNLQIIEKHPDNLNTVRNLVVLYRDLDHPEEASQWGERALALIDSGHGGTDSAIPLYSLLVDLNIGSGRLQESVDLIHRLIDLAPDEFRYPYQLAKVYNELGNRGLARKFAQDALVLAPEDNKPDIQAFAASLE